MNVLRYIFIEDKSGSKTIMKILKKTTAVICLLFVAHNVDLDLSEAERLLSLKGDAGNDGEDGADNGIPLGGGQKDRF